MVTRTTRLGAALLFLLVPIAAGAPTPAAAVRDEKARFEIKPPAGGEWEAGPTVEGVPAHYRLPLGDDRGEISVQVRACADQPGTLAEVAERLREILETGLGEPSSREERDGTLGGAACVAVDLETADHDVTWEVCRHAGGLLILFVRRTGEARDDEELERDVAAIRASFRLLEPEAKPAGEAPTPAPPAPPPEPAKDYKLAFWRLHLTKPAGFKEVAPDAAEAGRGAVLRFEARAEQTLCLIRVYALTRQSHGWLPLEKAVARIRREFEERYEKRLEPKALPGRWEIPLEKESARLELIGKRATAEHTRWFLADCRNGRRYQVEIFVRGDPATWEEAIAAFLASFQPQD